MTVISVAPFSIIRISFHFFYVKTYSINNITYFFHCYCSTISWTLTKKENLQTRFLEYMKLQNAYTIIPAVVKMKWIVCKDQKRKTRDYTLWFFVYKKLFFYNYIANKFFLTNTDCNLYFSWLDRCDLSGWRYFGNLFVGRFGFYLIGACDRINHWF